MPFLKSLPPDAVLKDVLRTSPAIGVPFAQWHEELLRGPSPFSVGERELFAAYVSALNACGYCHGEHEAVAVSFGIAPGVLDGLLADIDSAPVEVRLKPVFAYLRKLTLTPSKMIAADAEAMSAAGWSEEALYHAASVCAMFCCDNRIIQGLGLQRHSPQALAEVVGRLHDFGYRSTIALIEGRSFESLPKDPAATR